MRFLFQFKTLLIVILLLLNFQDSFSEGTKEAMVTSTSGTALLVKPDYSYGSYRGCSATNRIYFRIKDFNIENFYFGLKKYMRIPSAGVPTNVYYRILNPSGTQVVAPTAVPSSGTGYISSYTQAVAGPNIGGLVPTGYTPISYHPTVNGEFYIEIYRSNDAGATADFSTNSEVFFPYFDFTVATTSNVRYTGRVHSQAWSFITYNPNSTIFTPDINYSFEGAYYGYTNDSAVNKVTFGAGFKPLGYTLQMNYEGVNNTNTFLTDRRSKDSGINFPTIVNPYMVFLNSPDTSIYKVAVAASQPVITGNIYGCEGAYFIPYYIDKPGDVAILLDVNGTAGYQSGTSDRVLEDFAVNSGNNIMNWDGLDGLGATVTSGVTISITADIYRGRTNIPIYDAEMNTNGLSVTSIFPNTGSRPLYWDDTQVGASNPACGSTGNENAENTTSVGVSRTNYYEGITGPTHSWNGPNPPLSGAAAANGGGSSTSITCDDFGNARTINTWFWADNVASIPISKTVPTCLNESGMSINDDLDDDNDGISDLVESGGVDPDNDADADGIPNYLDLSYAGFVDANHDGVNDNFDADLDGIINSEDLDSDNDGFYDIYEAGGTDANNDGVVDSYADANNNGISDQYDIACTGGTTTAYGVSYTVAGTVTNPGNAIDHNLSSYAVLFDGNTQGRINVALATTLTTGQSVTIRQSANTGTADKVRIRRSTDGTNWTTQTTFTNTTAITNTTFSLNGNASYISFESRTNSSKFYEIFYDITAPCSGGVAITNPDTDGDGVKDIYDLDNDNDGIPDLVEAGGVDGDGDGRIDHFADANNNGIADAYDNNCTGGTNNYSGYANLVHASNLVTNPNNASDASSATYANISDGGNIDLALGVNAPSGATITSYLASNSSGNTSTMGIYSSANGTTWIKLGTNYSTSSTTSTAVIRTLTASARYIRISRIGQTNTNGRVYIVNYSYSQTVPCSGGDLIADFDTDGDGIKNRFDLDSDNDGIPDVVEAGGNDADNDGLFDGYSDADGDGFSDIVDGDENNDGIAENTVNALIITGNDTNGDGKPDSYTRANNDANGLPNPYDLDADGDGILDVREAGLTDATNDGIADGTLGTDGWSNTVDALASLNLPNTDGNGNPDYLDIDADNDGIVDNIEVQSTAAYIAPSGTDSDGDGIDNNYDNNDASFGGNASNGLTPVNTDGTDNPDYKDLDSDNDRKPDRVEGWDTDGNGSTNGSEISYVGSTDSDNDGLLDEYDIDDANINPTNSSTPSSHPDMNNPGNDRDWREASDRDGDGKPDIIDIDDDNDGNSDIVESGGYDPLADGDSDGTANYLDSTPGSGLPAWTDVNSDKINDAYDKDLDGIINELDLDSDNDGIPDIIEAGGVDSNNDGKADNYVDTDNDGLSDQYDSNNGGTIIANSDLDGDGIKNFLDLDSDGDGLLDVREAGFTDTDNNGIVDGTLGTDGWSNTIDALTNLNLKNTDAKGNPNYLDIDSDDDGIPDIIEAQSTAAYIAPSGSDSDGDGIDNNYDNNDASFGGSSNNGLTPEDTDGNGIPDYLDLETDGDGVEDRIEGWDTNGNMIIDGAEIAYVGTYDTDGDGLLDEYDVNDAATNPTNGTTPTSYPDLNNAGGDRDWREIDPDGAPLPFTMLEAQVNLVDDGALVSWETSAEINNNYFLVEKSQDGKSFEQIGTLKGARNSNSIRKYQILDSKPFEGISYYRITQVDFDGKSESFKPMVLNNIHSLDNSLKVYPNPARNIVSISTQNKNIQIQIFNSYGMMIMQLQNINDNFNIDISNLAPGNYIIKAVSNNYTEYKKLIVE